METIVSLVLSLLVMFQGQYIFILSRNLPFLFKVIQLSLIDNWLFAAFLPIGHIKFVNVSNNSRRAGFSSSTAFQRPRLGPTEQKCHSTGTPAQDSRYKDRRHSSGCTISLLPFQLDKHGFAIVVVLDRINTRDFSHYTFKQSIHFSCVGHNSAKN